MRLIIGNKNYSTWSLRPWLLLDAFELEFDEQVVSLRAEGLSERLTEFSGTARVPVLQDDDLTVWDSLAICEYINQYHLADQAWPQAQNDRAIARAICAEMHSGFGALRNEMPMNCRASRIVTPSAAALADVQRVDAIWSSYAQPDANGDLRLFSSFSIADCFFAPVVMRFATYQPELSQAGQAYADSMLKHPSLIKWLGAAIQEDEIIDQDEAGIDR